MSKKRIMARRVWMSLIGVILTALAIALFKTAAIGVDPFQCFVTGINAVIPISYGTIYVGINLALLCFSLLFDRHYLGLATFINLFLLGYMTEFFQKQLLGSVTHMTLPGQCALFAAGFLLTCFAASLYITADLGVSTYDAIALILTNKFRLGKFKYIRICTDVACVAGGAALYLLGIGSAGLGALVGIGTVITALGMGPVIDWFNRKVAQKLLNDPNVGEGQERT